MEKNELEKYENFMNLKREISLRHVYITLKEQMQKCIEPLHECISAHFQKNYICTVKVDVSKILNIVLLYHASYESEKFPKYNSQSELYMKVDNILNDLVPRFTYNDIDNIYNEICSRGEQRAHFEELFQTSLAHGIYATQIFNLPQKSIDCLNKSNFEYNFEEEFLTTPFQLNSNTVLGLSPSEAEYVFFDTPNHSFCRIEDGKTMLLDNNICLGEDYPHNRKKLHVFLIDLCSKPIDTKELQSSILCQLMWYIIEEKTKNELACDAEKKIFLTNLIGESSRNMRENSFSSRLIGLLLWDFIKIEGVKFSDAYQKLLQSGYLYKKMSICSKESPQDGLLECNENCEKIDDCRNYCSKFYHNADNCITHNSILPMVNKNISK